MSMFPGAGASVYYNEDGEPLGWDYPSYDEPDVDDFYADYDVEPPVCTNCGEDGHEASECKDDPYEGDPMEDQWLDSYMEDRLSTMFEG